MKEIIKTCPECNRDTRYVYTVGNKENNNIDNLEWATYSENEQHARANGKVIWNKGRFGIPANKPRGYRIKELNNLLGSK